MLANVDLGCTSATFKLFTGAFNAGRSTQHSWFSLVVYPDVKLCLQAWRRQIINVADSA
jgi:hypothetical protein